MAHAGEADAAELSAFTPSFLWLLRDFYFSLVEDGRTVRVLIVFRCFLES